MTRQAFNTTEALRLEVAIKPATPYNLVANPSGDLGAWGWVTPGASFMRGAAGPILEHVAAGAGTVFYTEPMPMTAAHYAAAAFTIPAAGSAGVTWQFEWLNATYGVISTSTASASLTLAGVYATSAQAPAGTAFMRVKFNQAAAGTARVTSVKAASAPLAASLSTVLRNEVPNPSFEVDTTGWGALGSGPPVVAAISRTTTAGQFHTGTAGLKATRTAAGPGLAGAFTSTQVNVTGGLDYTLQCRMKSTPQEGYGRLQIAWYDSGGAQIGATVAYQTVGNVSSATFDLVSMTATAPGNAVKASLAVLQSVAAPGQDRYFDAIAFTGAASGSAAPAYFDGSSVNAGTLSYAWTGTAHASTSTRSDTNLSGLPDREWRNILGPTHTIKTARESLNLGTLEAEVLDATLDPATSTTLRPGGGVRALALVGAAWEPFFVGEIDRLVVDYDEKTLPPRPPRISLTALDNTRRLAGARRPSGVAAVAELPFVLEGAGVPWDVNGSTAQILATPTIVSANDNATALDQVALTRDSTAAHAWVNRKGVLVATTTPAGAPVRTLTEPRYSDLQTTFTSESVMNAIIIESLTYPDAAGRSETVLYGPYEDAASIATWGRRERRFAVHGLTPAQVAALGAAILVRNATPGVTVQSVNLPMRSLADLDDAVRDLGEIVRVSNTAKALTPDMRVTSVQHTIQSQPAKWIVTLGFTTSGSVAAPTLAPEQPAPPPATPTVAVPAFGSHTSTSTLKRVGQICHVALNVTATAAQGGGAACALLPVGYRPVSVGFYFTAANVTTGATVLMYAQPDGGIYYALGVASGVTTVGTFAFII